MDISVLYLHILYLSAPAALTSSSQGAAAAASCAAGAAATPKGSPLHVALPLLPLLFPGLIGDDRVGDHRCDCAEVGVECVGEATPNSSGARPKTSTRARVVSQLLLLLLLDEGRSDAREEGMMKGQKERVQRVQSM